MNTAVKENVVAVIPPRRKPAEPAAPAAEEKVLEAGSKDITGKVESIIIETEDDYLELRDTTPKAVLLPEKDALQIIPREEYEYLLRLQTEAEKAFLKEGGADGI